MSRARPPCGILLRVTPTIGHTRGALIAGLVLLSVDAFAFSIPGHKWPAASYPVGYRLHADGAPGITDGSDLDAIRRAFMTWQDVACSDLTFREETWADPAQVARDDVNRIFWVTDRSLWPGQASTLALTYTFFRTSDNVVTDADMIGNGADWQWTTVDAQVTGRTVDLETVVFHEVGHFFGLDHSQDPNAAMFASNNTPIRRLPLSDDIAGICTLYTNGMQIPNTTNPNDPGVIGASCQAPGDCASSICVADSGRQYCSARCNPSGVGDCPVNFPCIRTSQGDFCLEPVVVDELCDQCQVGSQCQTGLCLTVPGANFFRPFCTRACDPTPGGPPQCPEGYRCELVQNLGQTGGVCTPNTGVCNPDGKGGHNEPCYANGGCKSGHTCIQYYPNQGPNFCYFECQPELAGRSCTDQGGVTCLNVDSANAFGRMNTAVCFNIAAVGEPCIPEVCETGGFCAFDENQGIDSALCYQTCPTGACPANTQCISFDGLPNLCVPNAGFLRIGQSCLSNEECESRMCRTFGNNQLCTQICATTDPNGCPGGTRCIAAGDTTNGQCWPENSVVPDVRGGIVTPPADYCICDSTSACDKDCDCDPECKGSCGCTTTETSGSGGLWLFMLGAVAVALRRRR